MTAPERYRRLLRWYPKPWRDAHGEVLLGTALEVAEAEGRTAPRASEAWAMRLNGLGERLTAPLALWSALLALALSSAATVLLYAGQPGTPMPAMLWVLAAPVLLTVSLFAALRHTRAISPPRAVGIVATSLPAWALGYVTVLSWSVGFAEADAGGIRSPFGMVTPWLLLASWATGALIVFFALTGIESLRPRALRYAIAAAGGLVLPPVIGLSMSSPATMVGVSVAIVVMAALASSRTQSTPVLPTAPRVLPRPARRALAWGAVATGVAVLGCVAFSFGGSTWVPVIDSTRAMQLGGAAGILFLLPFGAALGAMLAHRLPHRAAWLWAATALYLLGLLAAAMPALVGDVRTTGPNWISMGLGGLGIATLIFALTSHSLAVRAVIAAAAGLGYAAILGWALPMYLPFFGPILAAVVAVWGFRSPRPRSTKAAPLAPRAA